MVQEVLHGVEVQRAAIEAFFGANRFRVDFLGLGEVPREIPSSFTLRSGGWTLKSLGGGFKYVLFSPRTLGKMHPFWLVFFQLG